MWRRMGPGGLTGLQNRVARRNVARMVRLHPFSAIVSLQNLGENFKHENESSCETSFHRSPMLHHPTIAGTKPAQSRNFRRYGSWEYAM